VIQTSAIACLKDILKRKTMESFLARGGHDKLVKSERNCQKMGFSANPALSGGHRIGTGRDTELCGSLFERYFQGEHE
jgi:hypothetical protein